MTPIFLYETDLSKRLGIPQHKLRKIRQELLKPSWVNGDGTNGHFATAIVTKEDYFFTSDEGRGRGMGRVRWMQPALEYLEKTLNVRVIPEHLIAPAGTEELKIVRAHFPNKKVMECTRGNGEKVMVRVKDSTNYKPHMTIKARKENGSAVWMIYGRAPRYPGRW